MKNTQRRVRAGRGPRCTELGAALNWIARGRGGANQGSAERCGAVAGRGHAAAEPRRLAAPPARAARPGLIQVASALAASRHPQVCPFCFWCLHVTFVCRARSRVSVVLWLWVFRAAGSCRRTPQVRRMTRTTTLACATTLYMFPLQMHPTLLTFVIYERTSFQFSFSW